MTIVNEILKWMKIKKWKYETNLKLWINELDEFKENLYVKVKMVINMKT